MHRREGHPFHQPGGHALGKVIEPVFARACWQAIDKGSILQPAVQGVAVLGEFRMGGGVHHIVDKFLHWRLFNTVKVVANAHIENKRFALFMGAQRKDLLEQMQREPGFQVFIPGFLEGKFGGPFGVKALIFGIDTGLFQLQTVKDLYGFQLDKPPAGEPCGNDVLRQLGMRPGCRAERRRTAFAEYADRPLRLRRVKLLLGNAKNSPLTLILVENAR